jgi:hypothetical protein
MMNKTVLHQEKVIFVEIMKDVVQVMEVDPPPPNDLSSDDKSFKKKKIKNKYPPQP